MSGLSPNNLKTGIGSLRQYFNSRKLDSNNPRNPSRLSPHLKHMAPPTSPSNNPFFDPPTTQKYSNNILNNFHNNHFHKQTNYTSPSANNLFYNNSKKSNQYRNEPERARNKLESPRPHPKLSKSPKEDYVVNNFVNIQNLNIRNYYPQNDAAPVAKS